MNRSLRSPLCAFAEKWDAPVSSRRQQWQGEWRQRFASNLFRRKETAWDSTILLTKPRTPRIAIRVKISDQGLDKASDAANNVTGGKFEDQINQGRDGADDKLGNE